MKKLLGLILLVAILISSCDKKTGSNVKLSTETDSISYFIGLVYAKNTKMSDFKVDPKIIALAFEQVLAGDSIKFSEQDVQMKLQMYYMKIQNELNEKNKEAGEKFLSENKTKPGVITLPSGLQYQVIKEGTGPIPDSSDVVSCNYIGTLVDGKEFDSSAKSGGPAKFAVTGVIRGWTEALLKMKVGSKWKVFIPYNLGYGEQRRSEELRGFSALIFEMELLGIEPKPEPTKDVPAVPNMPKRKN